MPELNIKRRLDELEYIRVTSWRTFEECPHEWAAIYLADNKSEDTEASRIGTAVHKIMENFQLKVFRPPHMLEEQRAYLEQADAAGDGAENPEDLAAWKVVPAGEVDGVYQYMDTYDELAEKGYMLMALEEEVDFWVPGVPVKIRGHLDARWLTPTAAIMIDDHKTNRSYDGASWWREQLQQMLYAYATRQRFPGKRIVMRIGYPNLGRHVEWETDPEDDERLVHRIQKLWADMQRHEAEGVWPKTVHDKCVWCPVRKHCVEYERAIWDFKQSSERRLFPLPPTQQLSMLRTIKKLVDAKEEELEEQVRAEVAAAGGSKLIDGEVWYLETGERRAIPAETAFRIISAQVAAEPSLGPVVISRMDDVFTAKVGGIDKLIRDTGGFGELKKYIVKKPNANATLKSRPSGKINKQLLEGPAYPGYPDTHLNAPEGQTDGDPF